MRLLTLVLLSSLFACSSGPSPAPAATANKLPLEDFKLPATNPLASEQNAIIDHAIAKGYDLTMGSSGYFFEILEPGEYGNLLPGDIVTAHYTGSYLDGTVFDKSKPGQPLRFTVGQLIDAWNFGLTHAKPGGSIRIIAPARLCYGAEGLVAQNGDVIVGANQALEFVISDIEIHEE